MVPCIHYRLLSHLLSWLAERRIRSMIWTYWRPIWFHWEEKGYDLATLPDSVKVANEEKNSAWFRKQGGKRITSVELAVQLLFMLKHPWGAQVNGNPKSRVSEHFISSLQGAELVFCFTQVDCWRWQESQQQHHLKMVASTSILPCCEGACAIVEHLSGHVKTDIQQLSLSPLNFSNTATCLGPHWIMLSDPSH